MTVWKPRSQCGSWVRPSIYYVNLILPQDSAINSQQARKRGGHTTARIGYAQIMPPDALLSRQPRLPRSRPAGAALWTPRLDRGAAVPLSRQLAAALRAAIAEGRLGAGARLPSTRALAAELGLARSTIVGVFAQLAAEGYIAAQPGPGQFVPAALVDAAPVGAAREAIPAARPVARCPAARG